MSITANIPISTDQYGVIRVGATRVTLDTLLQVFIRGATPEEIVFQYPVLELADVYAVIGFYLNNRDNFELYLQQVNTTSEAIHVRIQEQFPADGIRSRLMARQAEGLKGKG